MDSHAANPFDAFRRQVEEFIASVGMNAAEFGKRAMGDPNFVYELRGGRSPRAATIERVTRFISEHRGSAFTPQASSRA